MLNPETSREVQLLKEYQHYISLSYQYSKLLSQREDEIDSLKDRIEKLEDIIEKSEADVSKLVKEEHLKCSGPC